ARTAEGPSRAARPDLGVGASLAFSGSDRVLPAVGRWGAVYTFCWRQPEPLENSVEASRRKSLVRGPRRSCERAVAQPFSQPLAGHLRIALPQPRTVFECPPLVVSLLHPDGRREDERQAERPVERELARLGP